VVGSCEYGNKSSGFIKGGEAKRLSASEEGLSCMERDSHEVK
jgi:hypothetical protein